MGFQQLIEQLLSVHIVELVEIFRAIFAALQREQGWSDMEFQVRNWQHFTWLSGDQMVEQAVHSVDKMNWCFRNEPPKSAVASEATRSAPMLGTCGTARLRWPPRASTRRHASRAASASAQSPCSRQCEA